MKPSPVPTQGEPLDPDVEFARGEAAERLRVAGIYRDQDAPHIEARYRLGAAQYERIATRLASLASLREAVRALVEKLDECKPHMDASAVLAYVHGQRYTGPNFATELTDLRAALGSPAAQKEEHRP